MKKVAVNFCANLIGLYFAGEVLKLVSFSNIEAAVFLSILLTVIFFTLRPILVIITLPINLITLGLFSIVLNSLLFLFADMFVSNIDIGGFWNAVATSIIVYLISQILKQLLEKESNKAC